MKKLLIICAIFSLLCSGSCRSKKKITERKKVETELSIVSEVIEKTKKDITTTNEKIKVSEKTFDSSKETFKAKPVDPTKPITITDNATGKSYTATNAEIEFTSEKENLKESDSTSTSQTIEDKSEIDKSDNKEIEGQKDESSREANSEAKGVNSFIAIGIGLAVIAIGVLMYLKRGV